MSTTKEIIWVKQMECLDDEKLNGIPSVIAHEYDRVKEMLEDGHVYGALMQLKDVVETIIKFYAVTGLSYIEKKAQKEDKSIELLAMVLDKKLSLGDWAGINKALYDLVDSDTLKEIYEGIGQLTDGSGRYKVVEWRNRCLGHGALGYSDTNKYRDDFMIVWEGVNEFLEEYAEQIASVKLLKKNGEKFECLYGVELADEIDGDAKDLYVSLSEKEEILLYPFLTICDKKIYFFDSFVESKKEATRLNYYWGFNIKSKKDAISQNIAELCSKYKKANSLGNSASNSQFGSFEVDDATFLYEMEEILKDNSVINDSVKAEYLKEWLDTLMKQKEKGVFLFQAPPGMGKTICAQQLEKRGKTKLSINNVTVKVLYLNESYNSKLELILQELEILMTHDKYGKLLVKGNDNLCIDRGADNKAEGLASYLEKTKNMLNNHGKCDEKLLLVIDGIDELPESQNEFLQYLPTESLLAKGIYILLLARTDEGLTDAKKQFISDLNIPADNKLIRKDKQEFNSLMTDYVKNKLPGIEENKINGLLNVKGMNFSYLHFMVNLLQQEIIDWNDRIEAEDEKHLLYHLLKNYFAYTAHYYSKKYYTRFMQVVYILSYCEHALTLKEISVLMGEDTISFELLGILQDLSGCLKVERKNENQYSFLHSTLKKGFVYFLTKQGDSHHVQDIITKKWIEQLKDIQEQEFSQNAEEIIPGEEYRFLSLLINGQFFKYNKELCNFFTVDYLFFVYKLISAYKMNLSIVEYKIKRCDLFCENIVMLMIGQMENVDPQEIADENGYLKKEYFPQIVMHTLYNAKRQWGAWIIDKQRHNDIKDLLEEESSLNNCYDNLCVLYEQLKKTPADDYVDAWIHSFYEARKEVLKVLCEVYDNLEGAGDLHKKYLKEKAKLYREETEKNGASYHISLIETLLDQVKNECKLGNYANAEISFKEAEEMIGNIEQDTELYFYVMTQKLYAAYWMKYYSKPSFAQCKALEDIITEYKVFAKRLLLYSVDETSKNYIAYTYNLQRYMDMCQMLGQLYFEKQYMYSGLTWYGESFKFMEEFPNCMKEFFYADIRAKVMEYAGMLVLATLVDEAETLLKTYIPDEEDTIERLKTISFSNDKTEVCLEYYYGAKYMIYTLKYPNSIEEINRYRSLLSYRAIERCNMIINHIKVERKLTLEDYRKQEKKIKIELERANADFIISEDGKTIICKKGIYAKKKKNKQGEEQYQFKKEKCMWCSENDCPAKKTPHVVGNDVV